jgi:hypothetical protein
MDDDLMYRHVNNIEGNTAPEQGAWQKKPSKQKRFSWLCGV